MQPSHLSTVYFVVDQAIHECCLRSSPNSRYKDIGKGASRSRPGMCAQPIPPRRPPVESDPDAEVIIFPLTPIQRVIDWNGTPLWMRVDPYIRRGYRRQLGSFSECFRSLFYLHNELVNIWSHLLPALFYLSAVIAVESDIFSYQNHVASRHVRAEDVRMVHIYLVGTVICLLASVSLGRCLFSSDLSHFVFSSCHFFHMPSSSTLTVADIGFLSWEQRTLSIYGTKTP